MRVSANAVVNGSREWLVWADGKTYASLGAAHSGLERALGPGVAIRDAIADPDEAVRIFRAVFGSRLRDLQIDLGDDVASQDVTAEHAAADDVQAPAE